MKIQSWYITVKFTGTGEDFEILTDDNVKTAMKRKLNLTTDDEYTEKLLTGISGLDFTIYADSTRVSINEDTYDEGEFVEDTVFESGGNVIEKITSIRLETGVTGKITFNILG